MKNNNGKHFIWGDYDYSEKSSKENSFNISNIDSKEEKKESNYFNPIKAKIKEGIEKIKTSELANKLSSKLWIKLDLIRTLKINKIIIF